MGTPMRESFAIAVTHDPIDRLLGERTRTEEITPYHGNLLLELNQVKASAVVGLEQLQADTIWARRNRPITVGELFFENEATVPW